MATEPFLINPPKRLRRKVKSKRRRRNPIGETLVTIGANPMRRMRRKSSRNPWYGDSGGHRIAALMRWGQIPKGKVSRHRKRRRVKHRRVVRRVRHVGTRRRVKRSRSRRWAPKHIRMRRRIAKQAFWATKYGHMLSHPRSHKVYTRKGFVTMATRRKRRRSSRRRRNTWFGQPRRHRRAARKGWRRGHLLGKRGRRRRVRHNNPMVGVSANPRRRRHVSHRRRHHRRHHGRRRNPAIMAEFNRFSSSLMNVKHWAPLAITGGLSAITGAVVPGMLGVYNPWAKYGVQAAVAFGGSILVERVAGREHGQAWMIVGVAMVGYQLLKDFVLVPYFPQFAVGLGGYDNYYTDFSSQDVSQRIDAFPSMNAFPSLNAYPGVGDEVGSYPYDGAGY